MAAMCHALLNAARLAHDQGSDDQAASTALAAIRTAAGELQGSELVQFDEQITRLLTVVDKSRRDPRRALHVVIAGDSLALPRPENTTTYDPRGAPGLYPTYEKSYPSLLRQRLREAHIGRDIVISNLSRASSGMPEVAADAYVSLFYLDPTAIVVHCGIVDCWPRGDDVSAPPKTDLPTFRAALQRLMSLRREYCATKPVVLVGLAPTDRRWQDRLHGINDIIDEYSRELAAIDDALTFFIDMRQIVDRADPYRTLHLDGIHLNEAGHALLANAIAERLSPDVLYASVLPARSGGATSNS